MNVAVRPIERLDLDLMTLAFETSGDCIKMLSSDGTLLLLNSGGAAVMGFDSPTDPIGRNWVEFWHGKEREVARAAVATAAGGRRATFEGYLPTVKGDPRWWENTITPLPTADHEPQRLLVISRDVTAQREAERARSWSEQLYKTLVEATSQIVWSRDLTTGRCQSRGWTEFTGLPHDAPDIEEWLSAVHPDDHDALRDSVSLAMRQGLKLTRHYRLRSKIAEWRWVEDYAVPVLDEAGRTTGWVGVVTDIHDRKSAEQRLRDEGLKLRLALDSAALGTWEIDLRTGTCNPVGRHPKDARLPFGRSEQ